MTATPLNAAVGQACDAVLRARKASRAAEQARIEEKAAIEARDRAIAALHDAVGNYAEEQTA